MQRLQKQLPLQEPTSVATAKTASASALAPAAPRDSNGYICLNHKPTSSIEYSTSSEDDSESESTESSSETDSSESTTTTSSESSDESESEDSTEEEQVDGDEADAMTVTKATEPEQQKQQGNNNGIDLRIYLSSTKPSGVSDEPPNPQLLQVTVSSDSVGGSATDISNVCSPRRLDLSPSFESVFALLSRREERGQETVTHELQSPTADDSEEYLKFEAGTSAAIGQRYDAQRDAAVADELARRASRAVREEFGQLRNFAQLRGSGCSTAADGFGQPKSDQRRLAEIKHQLQMLSARHSARQELQQWQQQTDLAHRKIVADPVMAQAEKTVITDSDSDSDEKRKRIKSSLQADHQRLLRAREEYFTKKSASLLSLQQKMQQRQRSASQQRRQLERPFRKSVTSVSSTTSSLSRSTHQLRDLLDDASARQRFTSQADGQQSADNNSSKATSMFDLRPSRPPAPGSMLAKDSSKRQPAAEARAGFESPPTRARSLLQISKTEQDSALADDEDHSDVTMSLATTISASSTLGRAVSQDAIEGNDERSHTIPSLFLSRLQARAGSERERGICQSLSRLDIPEWLDNLSLRPSDSDVTTHGDWRRRVEPNQDKGQEMEVSNYSQQSPKLSEPPAPLIIPHFVSVPLRHLRSPTVGSSLENNQTQVQSYASELRKKPEKKTERHEFLTERKWQPEAVGAQSPHRRAASTSDLVVQQKQRSQSLQQLPALQPLTLEPFDFVSKDLLQEKLANAERQPVEAEIVAAENVIPNEAAPADHASLSPKSKETGTKLYDEFENSGISSEDEEANGVKGDSGQNFAETSTRFRHIDTSASESEASTDRAESDSNSEATTDSSSESDSSSEGSDYESTLDNDDDDDDSRSTSSTSSTTSTSSTSSSASSVFPEKDDSLGQQQQPEQQLKQQPQQQLKQKQPQQQLQQQPQQQPQQQLLQQPQQLQQQLQQQQPQQHLQQQSQQLLKQQQPQRQHQQQSQQQQPPQLQQSQQQQQGEPMDSLKMTVNDIAVDNEQSHHSTAINKDCIVQVSDDGYDHAEDANGMNDEDSGDDSTEFSTCSSSSATSESSSTSSRTSTASSSRSPSPILEAARIRMLQSETFAQTFEDCYDRLSETEELLVLCESVQQQLAQRSKSDSSWKELADTCAMAEQHFRRIDISDISGSACHTRHWDAPGRTCKFTKGSELCRQVLESAVANQESWHRLSALARANTRCSSDAGAILLLFASRSDAAKFQLMQSPTFVTYQQLKSAHVLPDIVNSSLTISAEQASNSFVLAACVSVGEEFSDESQIDPVGPIICRSAAVSFVSEFGEEQERQQQERQRHEQAAKIHVSLLQRGINLQRQFPDLAAKLANFVETGVEFGEQTFHYKDARTGEPMLCKLSPVYDPIFKSLSNSQPQSQQQIQQNRHTLSTDL